MKRSPVARRLVGALALPILVLGLLTPAVADARLGVSPNFRLGVPPLPGRGVDAVSLAVNPRNARHIVEVNADWAAGQCEYRVSFDGGRRWNGGAFKAPAGFGDFPCNVGPHLAEHMQSGGVAFGSGQNVYATFASNKPKADGTEEGKSLLAVISRDGGRTWGDAQVVAAGGPSAKQGPDHVLPTIAVDAARAGGPSEDRIYVSAASGQAQREGASTENVVVVSSSDAGSTWGPAIAVNTAEQNAIEQSQPVIDRDGTVYVAWRERGRSAQPGKFTPQGSVIVSKSTDQGKTWTQTKTAEVTGYSYGGPTQFPFTAGQSFTASTFPRMGIDPRNDTLYLVYGQGPGAKARRAGEPKATASDHFINPDQDVWFQSSEDDSATWSLPRTINTAPLNQTEITQTRHPWVSVSSKGRVDVLWQDRRHWYRGCVHTHVACNEARLGDTYYTYSRDGGQTFSRNHRISDRSTNNDVGFDYRFGTYWAYAPAMVYQGANLLVGWMESRRGNLENDSQDVYLARVRHGVKGRRPVRRIGGGGAAKFSVAMSKRAYPGGPEAVLAGVFVTRPWTRLVVVNKKDVGGALAGGVLARANIGTVLATPAGGLTAAAKAEVARLAPIGAYVVGDEGKLSAQVISDLAAAGVPADQVVRLEGTDDADTARLVAAAADRRTQAEKDEGEEAFDAAIVVNPDSRDAVTAAVLAANRRLPVLFAGRDSVPAATQQALKDLAIDQTLVIGRRAVISDAVLAGLPEPRRLGRSDAFATSRAVVTEQRVRGVPDNIMYVTNGRNRMHTALLGAAVARIGGLQLVARGGSVGAQQTVRRSKRLRASVTRLVAVGK